MRVEIINTGTELLLGTTINSHLAYFGEQLFALGLRIERQICIPDGDAIAEALAEALPRADLIFVTGGLGPTDDDLTREIAARLMERDLKFHPDILEDIEKKLRRIGYQKLAQNVRRQAFLPEGAVMLPNRRGTAPGFYLEHSDASERCHLFFLPGPPGELHDMFRREVLPRLREIVPSGEGDVPRECREFKVFGIGESKVEDRVGSQLQALPGLELGYCARLGEVDIRCIAVPEVLERAAGIVAETFGDKLVSEDGRSMEEMVVSLAREKGQQVVTAESCTGGLIAHRITNVPGASEIFYGGAVSYANAAKERWLGVSLELLAKHGAVSEPVAAAMARGALEASGASHALSVTGIAGPGGGSAEKPVGTFYLGLASAGQPGAKVKHFCLPADRERFKRMVSQLGLDFLRKRLLGAL